MVCLFLLFNTFERPAFEPISKSTRRRILEKCCGLKTYARYLRVMETKV